MPDRTEKYFRGTNGSRVEPLCPFCGSKNVYPVRKKHLLFFKKVIAWSCANEKCRMYRRQFPNPSFGSGRGR